MPLFKKHHDAPVDSTNYPPTDVNDPNYGHGGPNAYAGAPQASHPSGVGGIASRQHNQPGTGYGDSNNHAGANAGYGGPTSTEYPSDANTYSGAPQVHPSGVGAPIDSSYGTQSGARQGHPGAATAGNIAGNQASQYNQPGTGYAEQPGTFNTTTSHPVRNEVGGAALGAEVGHHMGGHGGTGAVTGGLAGRERAHNTGENVHNTTATTGGGTTGNMSARDAKSLEMKGKAQQLAGLVLSSQSMKAKGYAKEQEAAAIRHHQMNVSEAESHEAQARLARERAGQGPYH